MVSGGAQSSSSEGFQGLGSLGIAAPFLGEAFGQPFKATRFGYQPAANTFGGGGRFTNQLFGPDSFQALSGLGDTHQLAGSLRDQDIGELINRALGFQSELMDTGFKTDIEPARELSSRIFREDFLPQILEDYGIRGLDPRDSDTQAALLREGSRRATELGALGLDLQEAATNRRLFGAQGAPGVLNLQNLGFDTAFASSDAGQVLGPILSLLGVDAQAGGVGTSSSESKGG